MSGVETADSSALGLRERKKLRTREAIARVALDLFLAHGFDGTTIKQIADAAEVAPRTVSGYFAVKEELVFPDHEEEAAALAQRLEQRRPGEAATDALRAWIADYLADGAAAELERSRRKLVDAHPALRTYERGLQERAERIIAAAVAIDLGLSADDLLPHMVGAATIAALDALGRNTSDATADEIQEQAMVLVDDALAFIAAGVDGLVERQHTGDARPATTA
jgi:AcrR family transcriptional regulator